MKGKQIAARRLTIALALSIVLAAAGVTAAGQRRAAGARRESVDLIVSGGTVVTMNSDRRVVEDGAVAVRGAEIVLVGTSAEVQHRFVARDTIDARGRVVIPGLINGHTHVPMTLFRGLADDLALDEWLTKYIFPAEAEFVTEEFVRAGTRLALAEMIRGGTTTFCDMYYFESAIADETARAGVRAILGETVIDFPVPDNKMPDAALRYAEAFITKYKGHPLVTPAVAPHAPYTVAPEILRRAHDLAERADVPYVIHVAETEKEVADVTAKQGARPVAYLDRLGVLDRRTIAAHVVFADSSEIETLLRRGAGVVHNPQSNMKLAAGIAPVPEMLRRGVRVGLGTDGAASNNDLDMWEEMDTAAKLHKVAARDPRVVTAREAFALATIGGARALHMDARTGSLEAGKLADLVIVDLDSARQTPLYDVYSHLVYATKAADVRTVVIGGRVVMRDRRLLTLDEESIKREARSIGERIRRRSRRG